MDTSPRHLAQFYGHDERPLIAGVARYLSEPVTGGGALLAVISDDRRFALYRDLEENGVAPALLIRTGRFRVLETRQTLAHLYEKGRLNYGRFDATVGNLVREMFAAARGRKLHAYGDMVADLWERGERAQAIELERFWNRLQAEIPFDLYCAYPLDACGGGVPDPAIAQTHTEIVPA
ncbi:MAG TPA: MEDS domain-containing protein [Candidatus Baltobacteraceae bacterium]|nr:MEDS domain-containing protein [Candidatus Baltobacteraceae bacterium]